MRRTWRYPACNKAKFVALNRASPAVAAKVQDLGVLLDMRVGEPVGVLVGDRQGHEPGAAGSFVHMQGLDADAALFGARPREIARLCGVVCGDRERSDLSHATSVRRALPAVTWVNPVARWLHGDHARHEGLDVGPTSAMS